MDQELTEKMNYINENIIEKGYNPEDVANFVMKKIGVPYESLSLEKLKQMVEEYKDKGLTETYKTIKINEKKIDSKEKEKEKQKQKEQEEKTNKTENYLATLYSPESYEIETDCQQENKLMELYRNNNLISITVSEPQKEGKAGFFSKTYMTYRVQCPQLKTDVRRSYADFEWFRNQLVIRYPLRVIPPIIKENVLKQLGNILKLESEELIEERKIRYLSQFMNGLTNKKLFRTSPILLEFLELDNDLFKKYQDKLNKKKYEVSISLDNLLTMKGKIKCELKTDELLEANKNINKYNSFCDLYNRLDSSISSFVSDLNNLNIHAKEISLIFNKLNENLTQYKCKNTEDMSKFFVDFGKIFNNWSISSLKQSNYFDTYFRETFNYLNAEINEMSIIYKNYTEFKNEYETLTVLVNKKKEQLFTTKNIDKWSVEPGTEDDIPMFIDDKKVAFEKMLHKETLLLKEEKKRIAAVIYFMNKQFDKLMKNQNERIKKYYESIGQNAKTIFMEEHVMQSLLQENKN